MKIREVWTKVKKEMGAIDFNAYIIAQWLKQHKDFRGPEIFPMVYNLLLATDLATDSLSIGGSLKSSFPLINPSDLDYGCSAVYFILKIFVKQ